MASNPVTLPVSAIDRIDAAIARIEAATRARAQAADKLAHRHEALRNHMADAVAALDDVIARESASRDSRQPDGGDNG